MPVDIEIRNVFNSPRELLTNQNLSPSQFRQKNRENSNLTPETINTESICSSVSDFHENTPIALSLDTPNLSVDNNIFEGVQPAQQCFPFIFINCYEYAAYHFVYVLSVRIIF